MVEAIEWFGMVILGVSSCTCDLAVSFLYTERISQDIICARRFSSHSVSNSTSSGPAIHTSIFMYMHTPPFTQSPPKMLRVYSAF
jgi:hypothetical protein